MCVKQGNQAIPAILNFSQHSSERQVRISRREIGEGGIKSFA